MPNQVIWFDLPVLDLNRAIKFYSAVLNAPVERQDYPALSVGVLPHQGDEVSGCLHQSSDDKPSDHGALLYFNCDGRLDEAIAAADSNGGRVLQPRHEIGPYGFRSLVLDSEGNRIALHSNR